MSNLILKLIKFGIGFILFIPLYVGGSFFFPFIFPKIWIFQLVTEIIFFFYVVLAIYDIRFRPKFNYVVYATLLLSLILIITSFTGIDTFRSFWGNTERMSGAIAWFHFVAFAFILSGVFKTDKEWRNFISIAAAVSVLEFFYVLAQYLEVSWVWLPGSTIGTIGNSDLLAIYAIFGAFFALFLWDRSGSTRIEADQRGNNYQRKFASNQLESAFKLNWIWIVAFFLNIGTLLLASSRGAILGFGSGLFVYIIILIWRKPEARKILIATILLPVILYSFLWLARGKNFVKNTPQFTRIVNLSLKDDTVQQRFTEWGIAWDAFLARPVFGWGPNNYLYLHNAYLNPRVYNLRETNFDRAHNAYLDYASMSGIIGLLGYLFLICVLFRVFFKNKSWVFVSLVVAYAVSSLFVFDSPASFIALFLTIGFASYKTGNPNDQIPNPKQIQNSKFKIQNSMSPQTIMTISILYFLFSIFLIWQISIKSSVANLKFVTAFSGLGTGKIIPAGAFESYKESLKYETLGTSEFRNQYPQWIQAHFNKFSPEERLTILNFGINELEKEVRDHPLVFSYMNLGQLYYVLASGVPDPALKAEFYRKTALAFEEAIKLAPKRLEVYYSYLQLAMSTKDFNRGLELIEKTTEFAPDYAKNWWYAGIANIAAGRDEIGKHRINKALTLWYAPNVAITNNGLNLEYDVEKVLKSGSSAMPPKQEILGVVNVYIKTSDYKALLLLYLGAKMEDQNDVGIHQSLALVYQNLGLSDKVQEELRIVERLSPK